VAKYFLVYWFLLVPFPKPETLETKNPHNWVGRRETYHATKGNYRLEKMEIHVYDDQLSG